MAGEQGDLETSQAAQEAEQAGFDEPDQVQEPTETPEPETTLEHEAAPEPKYVQLTQEQLDALMAKADKAEIDKAYGKIGEFGRVIAQLQQTTAAGQAIEVTADDFPKLREEFPELAELQAKDMNAILSRFKGTGVDMAATEKKFSEQVEAIRQQATDTSLDAVVGGDWVAEVNSDAYKTWIATQPAETRALEASDSIRDAAKLLRAFKARPKSEPRPSTRTQQLAAAVPPKGTGTVRTSQPTTEEEAFNAAS